jgi:hypothetical protein
MKEAYIWIASIKKNKSSKEAIKNLKNWCTKKENGKDKVRDRDIFLKNWQSNRN